MRTMKHEGQVVALAASADRKLLLVGGKDRRIVVRAIETGEEVDTIDLTSSTDSVESLAFSPDAKSFVVGTGRGVVLRFDLRR